MAFLDEVAWPQQPAWPTGLITDGEVAACAEDPLGFKANLNPKPNNGYPRILKGEGHRGSSLGAGGGEVPPQDGMRWLQWAVSAFYRRVGLEVQPSTYYSGKVWRGRLLH
jgi:hypothetical protein